MMTMVSFGFLVKLSLSSAAVGAILGVGLLLFFSRKKVQK